MSAVNIASLLTIIEDNARSARLTLAQAEIMAANMDLNAPRAVKDHQDSIQSLLNNTAALHRVFAPQDPTTNGRLKIA